MFYEYSQNNSGGSFDEDANAGISHYVIIEAATADKANSLARQIGLYFDGYGDCTCCGNRWHEADELDGSEVPSLYGEALPEGAKTAFQWMAGPEGYIHYLDGRVVPFGEKE